MMYRLITFYARNPNLNPNSGVKSATGHIWFRLDDSGIWGFRIIGVKEEKAMPNDGSVTFKVTEEEYRNAVNIFKSLENNNYFIDGDTCIGLACKVAIAAGLKLTWGKSAFHRVGVIAGLPTDYLASLRRANPGKIFP